MTKLRRYLFGSLGIALCLGLAWVGLRRPRAQRVARAFDGVAAGQTADEVRATLGPPELQAHGGPSHWCDEVSVTPAHASEQDRGCKVQWLYQDWPAPACFTVCFGQDGRVVGTYHYVSP